MPFRVTARTLLHLGAELISSDGIAFYELIKNAFDANSKRVDIRVVVRIPHVHELYSRLLSEREQHQGQEPDQYVQGAIRDDILNHIDESAPEFESLKHRVLKAYSWDELEAAIEEANYINIQDTGEGMSLDDLTYTYLTIGTRYRLKQREQQEFGSTPNDGRKVRPILGEKGVGRLSAMRLGRRLHVTTSRTNESYWNELYIDWTWFSHDSDKLIEDIVVAPRRGQEKLDPIISGTTIKISGLEADWSQEKLVEIAATEFSKLTDPFVADAHYPIKLYFNGHAVSIPRLDRIIFEHAHAIVEAHLSFDTNGEPQLSGKVDYRLRRREKFFELRGTHLISLSDATPTTIRLLGPFKVRFYWFNRQILTAIDGIGNQKQVRELIARWAGGLMLYRDGFRVNPYGSPDDDWLDLDRKALASGGYKVNRRQIIGKVEISSLTNPRLVDQTNREGLRDSDERRALITILKFILESVFRSFLNEVDNELRAREPVQFHELAQRVEIEERQVQRSLQALLQRYPQVKEDSEILPIIQGAIDKIRELMNEAAQLADSYDQGRTQLLNLAGLGLMVEILAHELNRATSHTIKTLANTEVSNLPTDMRSIFATLESQLRTLQKRLRIIDPLSTVGRQTKETFDVVGWVQEIVKSHEGQFRRHGIRSSVLVYPKQPNPQLRIKVVRGMIVQILENLLSNSIYWLKQQRKLQPLFVPEITITINVLSKEISITDNGPGVDPSQAEEIFQPFVTTKPPGEGKGLGLFISQEIARYNGADLYLLRQPTVHTHMLNTFVLVLEAKN